MWPINGPCSNSCGAGRIINKIRMAVVAVLSKSHFFLYIVCTTSTCKRCGVSVMLLSLAFWPPKDLWALKHLFLLIVSTTQLFENMNWYTAQWVLVYYYLEYLIKYDGKLYKSATSARHELVRQWRCHDLTLAPLVHVSRTKESASSFVKQFVLFLIHSAGNNGLYIIMV